MRSDVARSRDRMELSQLSNDLHDSSEAARLMRSRPPGAHTRQPIRRAHARRLDAESLTRRRAGARTLSQMPQQNGSTGTRENDRTSRDKGGSNGGDASRSRRHGTPERGGSRRLDAVLAQVSELQRSLATRSEGNDRERVLLDENFKLRRRNARLLDELESGGGIPDGSHVLNADEFAEFEAYRALNVKPDALKTVVEEHKTLSAEKTQREGERVYRDAAVALDVANPKALVRLLKSEGLDVKMVPTRIRDEETGRNITVDLPQCRKRGDDKAAYRPLDEYIESELADFIPALNAEPIGNDAESDDDDVGAADDVDDTDAAGGRSGGLRRRGSARGGDEHEGFTDYNEQDAATFRRLGRAARSGMTGSGNGNGNGARRTSATAASGVAIPTTRGAERPGARGGRISDEKLVENKKRQTDYSL
jgi:hypothetical protein